MNKKPRKEYTEADLVSFGQHLLSKEREERIKADEPTEKAHEMFRMVTHAAVYSWIENRKQETEKS